jgi:hypothetical protein
MHLHLHFRCPATGPRSTVASDPNPHASSSCLSNQHGNHEQREWVVGAAPFLAAALAGAATAAAKQARCDSIDDEPSTREALSAATNKFLRVWREIDEDLHRKEASSG